MALGLGFKFSARFFAALTLASRSSRSISFFANAFALLALAELRFSQPSFLSSRRFLPSRSCCLINSRFAFTSAAEVAGSLGRWQSAVSMPQRLFLFLFDRAIAELFALAPAS